MMSKKIVIEAFSTARLDRCIGAKRRRQRRGGNSAAAVTPEATLKEPKSKRFAAGAPQ